MTASAPTPPRGLGDDFHRSPLAPSALSLREGRQIGAGRRSKLPVLFHLLHSPSPMRNAQAASPNTAPTVAARPSLLADIAERVLAAIHGRRRQTHRRPKRGHPFARRLAEEWRGTRRVPRGWWPPGPPGKLAGTACGRGTGALCGEPCSRCTKTPQVLPLVAPAARPGSCLAAGPAPSNTRC
jgi:hypothetical protein